MADFQARAEAAKAELNTFTEQLHELQKQAEVLGLKEEGSTSKRLEALKIENRKLNIQKLHLERSIEAGKKAAPVEASKPEVITMNPVTDGTHMVSFFEHVSDLFKVAIKNAFPEESNLPIAITQSGGSKGGDYQCNSALAIPKLLKGKPGAPANPREAALRIIQHLPISAAIAEVSVAGPGFINVNISTTYLTTVIQDIVSTGVKPPMVGEKKRVAVDFSSPNVAKEMHVGHLRSTIIGDTICRMLEFLGHDVLRINHVGDWGTQFGMLIAHLKDRFPNFETVSPPISDLQAFYKEAKKRFDAEEEFNLRARTEVVKLQNGDPVVTKAWKLICSVSRHEFEKVYDRLKIRIQETGESFYQPLMPAMVQRFVESGAAVEEEGRKVVFVPGNTVPLTIEKSDGGFTYDTSDCTALNYRANTLNADWVLYVVDLGQALHFELVFAACAAGGIYDPKEKRVEHIGFGVVQGDDKKKFKTRSGETVKLTMLLDEALVRARKVIEEKQATVDESVRLTAEEVDRAVEAVAYGAVKYADLKNNRTSDYIFSFDRMLDLKGNTAVYLLYAYTRIASIARRAGVADVSTLTAPIVLEHPKELKLAKHLAKFPEIINKIIKDIYPHVLCEYLYELSTAFTEFYDNCQ
eukprot:Ihof_evm5s300 gene=Ihof_evmTU5s300